MNNSLAIINQAQLTKVDQWQDKAITSSSIVNRLLQGEKFEDFNIENDWALLGEIKDAWLETKSPRTKVLYDRELSRFFRHIGSPNVRKVNLFHMFDFHRHLIQTGYVNEWKWGRTESGKRVRIYKQDADPVPYSEAAQAHAIRIVRSFFSYCHAIGLIEKNPFVKYDAMPKMDEVQEARKRVIDKEDIERMIYSQDNQRNKLILAVLYYSGMRINEVTDLKWSQTKFDDKDKKVFFVHKAKGKSEVTTGISKFYKEIRALRPDTWTEDEPVFKSRKGGRLTTTQIHRIVKGAAEKAGVEQAEKISAHWFRHSMATHAVMAGAPVPVVQNQLHHSSPATTGKYMHVMNNETASDYL